VAMGSQGRLGKTAIIVFEGQLYSLKDHFHFWPLSIIKNPNKKAIRRVLETGKPRVLEGGQISEEKIESGLREELNLLEKAKEGSWVSQS